MNVTKGKGWLNIVVGTWVIYFELDIRHWFIGFSLYIWEDGWNLSMNLLCAQMDIGQDPKEAWIEEVLPFQKEKR